ncbi:MAG: biotin--[acetyl-CoA-carboxylase] ligase [Clostridia bacterium]|nr:biotin--[acetyl-CoA-carboxylase] ligase [Clostridia bacterium]
MNTTQKKVLAILAESRGESVSGEELAVRLGVSRAAVWKAIEGLRAQGHGIEAATNRGYRLDADSDVLCHETVLPYLKSQVELLTPRDVNSTNTYLRELALQGAAHGTVALADKQSAGRGRRGRAFLSPAGGIYLSVLLRPAMSARRGVRLTIAACVGVCRALHTVCGIEAGIKWVNDLFVDGKKVCGILTEAATSLESGMLDYAVVGVGLNYLWPEAGFPLELKDIAGSLYGPGERPSASRGMMAAALIDSLMEALSDPEDEKIMEEYQARSIVAGKHVLVLRGDSRRPALAEAVLEDGCLRVRYEDGSMENLCSGEVSILPERE